MSFRADLEDFFESEKTNYNYEFKYQIEVGLRCRFLHHIQNTGKELNNKEYHSFLCDVIETELRNGSDKYGEIEQEWGLLMCCYEQEVEKAKATPYEPFRLWVLLDFILQLKE